VSKRVLVVEDDQPTQRLIATLLQRAGLTGVAASTGAAAIAALKTEHYDVAVVDLALPEIEGKEVIDYITNEKLPVPVVICSANPASPETYDPSTVRAVIRKPFDIDQFVATIVAVAGGEAPPRILIVEDEENARYILRSFVEPAEVMEAVTADDAMQLISEHRPDLILLDLMLPGRSGEEFLAELRADPATADLPVIIVTSRRLGRDERQTLMDFASGIIEKRDLSRKALAAILQLVVGESNDPAKGRKPVQ
jgi:CheY-like chemotaxis protein